VQLLRGIQDSLNRANKAMAKHKHQKAEKRLEEVMRGMSNL